MDQAQRSGIQGHVAPFAVVKEEFVGSRFSSASTNALFVLNRSRENDIGRAGKIVTMRAVAAFGRKKWRANAKRGALCTMPLMTRRSSTRALPRTSAGRCGSIRLHSWSVNQNGLRLTMPSPFNPKESLSHCQGKTINEF
jgi:hypothetical protein